MYECMNLLRNDVYNLLVNMHVEIKVYREFHHSIICIANGELHVRICDIPCGLFICNSFLMI